MFDWLEWFLDGRNAKTFLLFLFFITFILIVLYFYTGKRRTDSFEENKFIPLDDDDVHEGKELKDEHRQD
ncbi:MAG: CcoQ/FixQ family Cbb3-type cytochrome c oxidase assembly chaperone [Gammaproteobacteria bacterium]|nr:CcoQ/FixQ family Cbb3-type cytochrome c oxidase assembly chaperone [Gammaproteobacteria bacterium]